MPTPPVKPLATRERLSEVRYEIRGELARRAILKAHARVAGEQ